MQLNVGITRPGAIGLTPEDNEAFVVLWNTWQAKLIRNQLKNTYYEAKNMLDNMGISVPLELEEFASVVGWPAKAVDSLANRSIFEGFTFTNGQNLELNNVLDDNAFGESYIEGVTSELTNSFAVMTVTKGGFDEPPAIVSTYSAEYSSVIWDARLKRIKYGFVITEVDGNEPIAINMFTSAHIIVMRRVDNDWFAEYKNHAHRRPLMEALRYRPSLKRPLGKSRISRPVIDLTNAAMRTTLRTEVAAEFFTSPQRHIIGGDADMFEVDEEGNPRDPRRAKWDAILGAIMVVPLNSEGEKPVFGQSPQMTMAPHNEHLRSLAAQFSGETGVPMSSLGVIHDNPSSAEAIYAAKEDLVIEAEHLNRTNGIALKNIGKFVLATMQNKPVYELTDEEKSIEPRFKNPAVPSIVSQADAVVKIATAIEGFGQTDVALEELGLNKDQIMRVKTDLRKAKGRELLGSIDTKAPSALTDGGAVVEAAPVETPAGKQLNGAQTQSLIAIMSQFASGSITEGQAVRLIATAIGISQADARDILQGNLSE